MQKAVIIHGMPSREEYFDPGTVAPSHAHWFPWLQRQLILCGVLAQTPEMPTPYEARYEEWKDVLDGFRPTEDTMLVGHSLGAGFLVRWLSERDVKLGTVGKVVLVAPWLDPHTELTTGFFDFTIDSSLREKAESITVFISNDDEEEMHKSLSLLRNKLPSLAVREFTGMGHFISDHMSTNEFPELLNFLLEPTIHGMIVRST